MPVIFDDATIQRFSDQGEFKFAADTDCIIDRISLSVVAGTNQYTLPDYVLNVRRVTWRGKWMEPISHRKFREGYFPFSAQSEPTQYIYNNIGAQKIQFFPTPSETIAAATTNLYGSSIDTSVIVEFSRIPDYVTFTIPTWFRRYLLKNYVLKMCFAIESKGQNLKAVNYFTEKYQALHDAYVSLLEDFINHPRNLMASSYPILRNRPASPVLPANFGTYVE
jgi:hypothetical protein